MVTVPMNFVPTIWQAWANTEKFSANPENTDNYFWKMFTNILNKDNYFGKVNVCVYLHTKTFMSYEPQ